MNTNPFQIPACLQRADMDQRRRDRFKKGFIVIVAGIAALLVALLIEGCVSKHSQAGATAVPIGTISKFSAPDKTLVAAQKIRSSPQPNLTANPRLAPSALKENAAVPAIFSPAIVYVVKSGDTLTRIARTHGTTVQTIKSANGLAGDLILVGAKLKIPARLRQPAFASRARPVTNAPQPHSQT